MQNIHRLHSLLSQAVAKIFMKSGYMIIEIHSRAWVCIIELRILGVTGDQGMHH
jgi:hypothetical protein